MIDEFHYRIRWRAHTAHPGHHASNQPGGEAEFAGHVPLTSQPEPRNLDVRATLADPFGRLMVKSFRQHSAIPVYLLADLSASMGFNGQTRKLDLLADFAASTAYSAYRTGDPFCFFGCDESIRWELAVPLRWHKGFAQQIRDGLANFRPHGRGANGLLEVAPHLGRQRALLFVASDFHWQLADLVRLLEAFVHHDLIPVVLWDSAEYEDLPRFGLAELLDPETGEWRRLFLRPALRRSIRERYRQRRQQLTDVCRQYGLEPLFLVNRLDADALTDYFYRT